MNFQAPISKPGMPGGALYPLQREELRQFERRSQRGGASKLAAGTGHDDMVVALALAGWWAYENKSRALSGPELKALDY